MNHQASRVARVALVSALVLASGSRARAQGPASGTARPADAPPAKREVVPPKLVKFVEAEFPPSELAAEKSATVTLQIAIRDTGDVAAVAVSGSAGPAFDAAAVAAAKQFVFEPATVNGKAIPVRITYRYEFTWTPTLIPKTTADFEGTVRERQGKKPVAGVKVALDTGEFVVTDPQGHFAFHDLPPGEHGVTLSGERLTTIATSESLEAGKKIDAIYEVDRKAEKAAGDEGDDLEIEVTAPRLDKQVVATEVAAEQGRKVPGTQGDVLKVVEDLPGVARAAVGSGTLVVWGSDPANTRVYVNDVRVPNLYHDGGFRSVMQSDMVRSVELIPGGYGPAYGRGLGGLVNVQLRRLDEPGFHGSASADTLDAALSVRDEVSDHLHVAIGGRKSYLDAIVNAVETQNVGAVVPIPRYYDGQARIAYDLGEHESVEIGGLLSSDSSSYTVLSPDPALTNTQTTGLVFGRIYARYEKHTPDGSTIAVTPSWGEDYSTLNSQFGSTPTQLTSTSNIFALRGTWRGPVAKYLSVGVGIDAEVVTSSYQRLGSLAAPPREGDIYVFGQAPSGQINADTWTTVIGSVAPYAEADIAPFGDRLHVVPGVRFEPYFTDASKLVPPSVGNQPVPGVLNEDKVIEPRISLRYAVTPQISAKLAFGIYHQPPSGQDMSAIFGTPTLGLSQAQHYVAGGAIKLTKSLDIEVTGFLSESQDLVTRSEASTPALANALVQDGIGRSFGTQFLLRQQQIGPFFGWISYTISRSERKDHPDVDWRLFDFDQTHVFTALGSFDLGLGFEIGARFRFATGFPRTPVDGAFYDTLTGSYQPLFGLHNSIRIPPFYALDGRVSKRFKMGKTELEVYLDVQNVTNHANPEEILYNPSYTQRGYITGLPILPVIGARLSW
jgi:TonB family protein